MIRPPIIAGARVTGAFGNKFVSMLVHLPILVTARGVAGKSFAGRQEVVALENYWIACKDLPMALVFNSTMAT